MTCLSGRSLSERRTINPAIGNRLDRLPVVCVEDINAVPGINTKIIDLAETLSSLEERGFRAEAAAPGLWDETTLNGSAKAETPEGCNGFQLQ